MLVYQCSSCKAVAKAGMYQGKLPALPQHRVTTDLPYVESIIERDTTEYDLCPECLTKPITFGNIELSKVD